MENCSICGSRALKTTRDKFIRYSDRVTVDMDVTTCEDCGAFTAVEIPAPPTKDK